MPADALDERLADLVEGIVRIAGGDLETRLPVSESRDQLDAVITGFNVMAQELMGAQGELEARVKTRTAMLMDAYRKMELMALTDPLTKLFNRTALETTLETSLSEAEVGGWPAMLLLDLDAFKSVNDTLGHSAGDEVLKIVATRLRSVVRKEDTVARLGGDEFAVVLQDTSSIRARKVAARIVSALAVPVLVDDMEVTAGASVGIAIPKAGDSALDVILYADTAMYAAKRDPQTQITIFTPELLHARQLRSALGDDLREAIENQQMLVYYQPIVALASGIVTGVEALVRWQHPARGLLMPDDFIPLAEEIGAMTQLTANVLETAVRQLRSWQDTLDLGPDFTVRVNLSAAELQRTELIDDVRRILGDANVSPGSLVLELTESTLVMGNGWDTYSMRGLQNLGVGLEIDDFGTGYSSISYLRRLPVSAVKVDRSLVGDAVSDPKQRAFVAAILQLVHACRLNATFEGIETPEQAGMLTDLDCHSGQGYYFGRPMPASEIDAALLTSFLSTPWRNPIPVQAASH